jgi:G3E family GTPase
MTVIDVYSGFLGAGKTTLIKKMIQEAYCGQQLVLIENEFGEIGIDGGFLQDAGINITEMNSGCICCSLVGDFGKALVEVIDRYHPDRIVIEPSGVGKLSDVLEAVRKVITDDVVLGSTVAVADAGKVKVYMKNFGEFYNDQIETASTIILSRTDAIPQTKLDAAVALLREHNAKAALITTPWNELTGEQIMNAMEGKDTAAKDLAAHEHHHHHDHEEGHCCCGHHGEHHHHHDHEEGHCCGHHGEHHHHHDHEEGCCCGHHHGEHHHHADEVFTSWGVETARKFTAKDIEIALRKLDTGAYGMILRAKGIVACAEGGWLHFDYVPGEAEIRMGSAGVIGKLCVIGSNLDEYGVAAAFEV